MDEEKTFDVDLVRKEQLALDDEELRKQNTQKLVTTIGHIGTLAEDMHKTSKASRYYLWIAIGFFVILIGGAIVMLAIKSGGIDNFIDNFFLLDDTNKRVICYYGNDNMTFRSQTLDNAYYFKEIFKNSSCSITQK